MREGVGVVVGGRERQGESNLKPIEIFVNENPSSVMGTKMNRESGVKNTFATK